MRWKRNTSGIARGRASGKVSSAHSPMALPSPEAIEIVSGLKREKLSPVLAKDLGRTQLPFQVSPSRSISNRNTVAPSTLSAHEPASEAATCAGAAVFTAGWASSGDGGAKAKATTRT